MFTEEEISPNWGENKKKKSGSGDFLNPTLLDLWTCSNLMSHLFTVQTFTAFFVLGTNNNSRDAISDKVPF